MLAAALVWLALLAFPVGFALTATLSVGRLVAALAAVLLLVVVYVRTVITVAGGGCRGGAAAGRWFRLVRRNGVLGRVVCARTVTILRVDRADGYWSRLTSERHRSWDLRRTSPLRAAGFGARPPAGSRWERARASAMPAERIRGAYRSDASSSPSCRLRLSRSEVATVSHCSSPRPGFSRLTNAPSTVANQSSVAERLR